MSLRKSGVLVIAMLFVSWLSLHSQRLGIIKGSVQLEDGTKLPGVAVSVQGRNLIAVTDQLGNYTLVGLSQGEYTIIASLDNFREQKKTVIVQEGVTIVMDFVLRLAPIKEEATVTAERPLLTTAEEISTVTLTPRQIETLPSLGERDVFRAFQLLPGIMGSNESSSGLYIRGGTPDQNLISYDGFTIYHVDHLYGYFTAFNMEAIQEVRLSKGGYEAKYGGRLSSIMELIGRASCRERV